MSVTHEVLIIVDLSAMTQNPGGMFNLFMYIKSKQK